MTSCNLRALIRGSLLPLIYRFPGGRLHLPNLPNQILKYERPCSDLIFRGYQNSGDKSTRKWVEMSLIRTLDI